MQRHGTGKWLKAYMLSFVAVLVMFLGGCGGGSGENTPPWNIQSGWSMFYATKGTPGEQGPNLFTFTTSGNTVGGITSKNEAIAGTINGLAIEFHFIDSTDGATNTSTGTIAAADGATMSGTWKKTNGQTGTWHGVIQNTPGSNVTGNWNLFQTTSGVAGEQALGLFTLTQSGYTITGTPSDGAAVTGAVGLSAISFFWVGSDDNTHTLTGTITVDAKHAATSMSGTWYDTNGKTGTWRATKG